MSMCKDLLAKSSPGWGYFLNKYCNKEGCWSLMMEVHEEGGVWKELYLDWQSTVESRFDEYISWKRFQVRVVHPRSGVWDSFEALMHKTGRVWKVRDVPLSDSPVALEALSTLCAEEWGNL